MSKLTVKQYLQYCTAQGGNICALYMSGMKTLRETDENWQTVYDALPDGSITLDVFMSATEHLVDWDNTNKALENTVVNGQIEIDHKRGVIYFHLTSEADVKKYNQVTVFRICGLDAPIPALESGQIDVTLGKYKLQQKGA